MSVDPTIITRVSGISPKGSGLTNTEIDANFLNLKSAVVSVGDQADAIEQSLDNFSNAQDIVNNTTSSNIATHESRLDAVESSISDLESNISVEFIKADGTVPLGGDLNFNNQKAINLATPTNPEDGASKGYVDTEIDTVESSFSAALANIQADINAIDLSPYLKSDGTVPLSGDMDCAGYSIISVASPVNNSDVVNKEFLLDRIVFVTETRFNIENVNVYSSDLVANTYAYEFANNELLDKIIFDSNVDTDNTTFPNKAYTSKVRFSDIFSTFPDNMVDLKLVNRSTGKLSIDVCLNSGTKIFTLPPRSDAKVQWGGSSIDPVWLVTLNKNHSSLEDKRASNFIKAVIGVASDGTIKTNHSWINLDQADSPAISFNITHTAATGIYSISWINSNSFNSNVLNSPIVIPTLVLTSADTDDYKIYAKEVTSSGCEIHIKDSTGYIDKDFSIILGGHNSTDGNTFGNPFLV